MKFQFQMGRHIQLKWAPRRHRRCQQWSDEISYMRSASGALIHPWFEWFWHNISKHEANIGSRHVDLCSPERCKSPSTYPKCRRGQERLQKSSKCEPEFGSAWREQIWILWQNKLFPSHGLSLGRWGLWGAGRCGKYGKLICFARKTRELQHLWWTFH